MNLFKKPLAILSLLIIVVFGINYSVYAEEPANSDLNFSISFSSTSVLRGDTINVEIIPDRDYTLGMFSALAWQYSPNLEFEMISSCSDVIQFNINHRTNLIIVSTDEDVEVRSGEPIATIQIRAIDNATIGKYSLTNIDCNLFNTELDLINATCGSINFSVVSSLTPTAAPGPTATPYVAPATSAPTSKPSSGNNTGIDNPTATPKPTTKPTSTPDPANATPKPTAPTAAPSATPAVTSDPTSSIFSDVTKDYWAYEYIMDLYEAGIVKGDSPTTFLPENNVTRAEFTKMAVGMFGLTIEPGESEFTDVTGGDWFAPYVNTAVKAGMVTGVSETEFAPNDTVTREQMATIIGRKLSLTSNAELAYADATSVEDYAKPYVAAMSEAGYLKGENNMFRPKDTATRAEASTVLDRVYKATK